MDRQISFTSGSGGRREANLYDYWKVIAGGKKIIAAVFLVSVVVTAAANLGMPKVYRGEAAFRITAKEIVIKETGTAKDLLTSKDLIDILGTLDREKMKMIFPKNADLVTDLRIEQVGGGGDKLNVAIESKYPGSIQGCFEELSLYINTLPLIRGAVEIEKARIANRLEYLNGLIKEYNVFAHVYDEKIRDEKLLIANFIPADVRQKALTLADEKFTLERTLKNTTGFERIGAMYISKAPVRPRIAVNVTFAAVAGLIGGVILAFFAEYIKRVAKASVCEEDVAYGNNGLVAAGPFPGDAAANTCVRQGKGL
ncbi:MAG TPA: hypothetical protein VF790_13190 [Dissulfurispiraceae bacterium]